MPRPALVRYAGLAGSVLLAVAAYLGGAHRPWQPTITPGTIFAGRDGVLLPLAWLIGTALLIGAWWVGRRHIPSARWAYVTAGLWMVPLLPFLPLGSYDAYSYACQGWQQAAGLDPYAGGVDLLGCPWRDAVAPTWLDSPAPYGPVFLLLAGAAAKLGGSLAGTLAVLRVIALLGVALIAACLPALARRAGVPLSRAVWLVLACPLIPIHLVSGAHNDAVMVGFLVAGLALALSRRAWAAGVLLGLAIGVKATAVVVVPFALLLVARRFAVPADEAPPAPAAGAPPVPVASQHQALPSAVSQAIPQAAPGAVPQAVPLPSAQTRPQAPLWRWRPAVGLLGGVLGALALVSLVSGRGFGWITGLAGSGVSVQWTAPATAVGMAIDLVGPDAVPVTRVVGIVALAGVLGWLWWRARRGDALRYAGYALAATVVLAPVFHPWYAVWPLAVLAATLPRETRWLTVPCAVAAALCLPDGYNLALAVKSQGAVLMTALLCYLGAKKLKAIYEAKNSHRLAAGPADAVDRVPGGDA